MAATVTFDMLLVQEEGRKRDEQHGPDDGARGRRVPKERRHSQPADDELLGAHDRGLRQEEDEAAPYAVAQRRLLQGEGCPRRCPHV